jgi:hypothetical protein
MSLKCNTHTFYTYQRVKFNMTALACASEISLSLNYSK